jgi:D-apionolactonase
MKEKTDNRKKFITTLTREDIQHGNHNENTRQLVVKAGMLSMIYENGNLRHISVNSIEIVRMIYSAVRDSKWITVPPEIYDEKINIHSDSFNIKYKARYRMDEIDFLAEYTLTGNSDNSLSFAFEGEALADFDKNRLGFCLLHPIEGYMGEKCTIIHSNGEAEDSSFPFYIAPHQPFLDIKSMQWNRNGISCSVDFGGDIFETEDQRNWTDASYKTYCTPLHLKRPARIIKGQKIFQSINLTIASENIVSEPSSEKISVFVDRSAQILFPAVGTVRSTRKTPLSAAEAESIRAIGFDHLRIELLLFTDNWKTVAEISLNEAGLLDCKAELALFLDDDYKSQIEQFVSWAADVKPDPAVVILYFKTAIATPDYLTDYAGPLLRSVFPGVMIGSGTNANFAQLNRSRPQSDQADYICYAVHPQEHASDNLTLVENLGGLKYTVESAGEFAGDRKIWVSPVNIQRRFNGNVSGYELPPANDKFPPQADSRLMSLFGGCWMAGSLKYLLEEGVAGITLLETVGERGILQGDFDSQWPDEFKGVKGSVFPVYHVLKFLLQCKEGYVLGSSSSHPLKVVSLVMSVEEKIKMILVNFTSEVQKADIHGWNGNYTFKSLCEATYSEAIGNESWLETTEPVPLFDSEPLILEPFSVNFIEG